MSTLPLIVVCDVVHWLVTLLQVVVNELYKIFGTQGSASSMAATLIYYVVYLCTSQVMRLVCVKWKDGREPESLASVTYTVAPMKEFESCCGIRTGHCANIQNAVECFLSPECRTSRPYKFDVGRKDNKEEPATEVFNAMVRNKSPKVGEVIDVIDTPLPPVNARARKESNKGGGR
uniref:Uncharacterized protein n=1 Tax=Tanacetum cinerariifolium TaxID=118510 RepID=A0A699GKE7_TANCI|nr:hypothetical protein [Tanacetum cinerariifolium]